MKLFCYHSFDLRQLVSFAETARAGSFRKAPKTLYIPQPALSRQINKLQAAPGGGVVRATSQQQQKQKTKEISILPDD
jgi:hypothetical protein